MKNVWYLAAAVMLVSRLAAQESKVYDDLPLKSKILNMERKFAVYLPAGYDVSQRSYPVLYLLHGGGDDQTGWVQFGEVQHIADAAIAEGRATPMIIVMPDANTGTRGYSNNATETWRYEDFFFQEFMPFIESHYRTRKDKRYRAVAGLSMGGDGTFTYALHHPELFSSACPLSAGAGARHRQRHRGRGTGRLFRWHRRRSGHTGRQRQPAAAAVGVVAQMISMTKRTKA